MRTVNILKLIILLFLLSSCSETKHVDVVDKLEALDIERLALNKQLIELSQRASDYYARKEFDQINKLMIEQNELNNFILSNFAESSGALDAIEEECDKNGKDRLKDLKIKVNQLASNNGINESFSENIIEKYWLSFEAFKDYMNPSNTSKLCSNIDKI
tara:strand:- start:48 stop:524 length:477 start_codon:yes stop_codon:yes gene_type:complete